MNAFGIDSLTTFNLINCCSTFLKEFMDKFPLQLIGMSAESACWILAVSN